MAAAAGVLLVAAGGLTTYLLLPARREVQRPAEPHGLPVVDARALQRRAPEAGPRATDARPAAPDRASVPATPRIARGTLNIVIPPEIGWATVVLDGKRLGDTPNQWRVKAGKHTVKVVRRGFVTETLVVTIRPGQVEQRVVNLRRER